MAGALLDTSVLIAPPGSTGLPPSAAISVITIGELRAGVALGRTAAVRAQREARLAAVRAAFVPLPVTDAIAEAYGDLLALARRERRITKATDLLIIATAMQTSRTLHTLDGAQLRLASTAGAETADG